MFTRQLECDPQNSPTHLVIKQALRRRMAVPAMAHKNSWEEKHLLSVERKTYMWSVFLKSYKRDKRNSYLTLLIFFHLYYLY